MVTLLKELAPGVDPTGLGFAQLRDELLKLAPLDLAHVVRR
jgi:L-galactono-1,4-lactone dehydrogenase